MRETCSREIRALDCQPAVIFKLALSCLVVPCELCSQWLVAASLTLCNVLIYRM